MNVLVYFLQPVKTRHFTLKRFLTLTFEKACDLEVMVASPDDPP
jgi:hypothetical protein